MILYSDCTFISGGNSDVKVLKSDRAFPMFTWREKIKMETWAVSRYISAQKPRRT